jgi:hypothetical protein
MLVIATRQEHAFPRPQKEKFGILCRCPSEIIEHLCARYLLPGNLSGTWSGRVRNDN